MSGWIEQSAPLPDIPTPKRRQAHRPTESAWEAHPDGRRTEIIPDAQVIAEADARERAKLDVELNRILETQAIQRDVAAARRSIVASVRPLGGSELAAARASVSHPRHGESQQVTYNGRPAVIFTGR